MHKMHPDYDHLPIETVKYIEGVVYRTSNTYNLRKEDAEDLKQEILLSVTNRKRAFDHTRKAALTTYLHLCVDGAVREYVRSMKRLKNTKLVFILDAPVSGSRNDAESDASTLIDCLPAEGSELEVKRTDLKNDVAAILAELLPEERFVCEMLMKGYSIGDIARIMNRPRQIIYSRILPALRKAFKDFS